MVKIFNLNQFIFVKSQTYSLPVFKMVKRYAPV